MNSTSTRRHRSVFLLSTGSFLVPGRSPQESDETWAMQLPQGEDCAYMAVRLRAIADWLDKKATE